MGGLSLGAVYIAMGVSGCGKSTVAQALAERIGGAMLDADDFHPPANVAKMKSGQPLDDADRAGWLARLNEELRARASRGETVVLACSALKERYRAALRAGLSDFRVVYLKGDYETISKRMEARLDHFMPATLLISQFEALEEPQDAVAVDIRQTVAEIVEEAVRAFAGEERSASL